MVAQIKKKLNESKTARWAVLIIASFAMATNYYFYDALAPLADLIRMNLGFSSTEYGFFISAYSIPNVFLAMAVLGGIILDRVGIRITGFSFIFLMAIGGSITAYGASDTFLSGGFGYNFMNSFLTSYSPALKMMSLGFFIFGLGAETSIVVLSKIIVKWFKGKELALALGLNLAIGRLGAALAFTLSPRLIYPEWTTAIWFGVMLLWIGLLFFLFYMIFDIKLDRQVEIDLKDPEDEFRWKDLKDLVTNRSVIYITLLCVTFYSAVFPFLKFAPDLLMNKFAMPRALAGDVTSYLMYGTILLTPLFGWVADNKGKSATLMYLGSALLIVAHLMFAKTYIEPRVPIVLLGIAFSLVPAAMWPAVTKIVRQSKLGTAYGFMFSVQNIGLWLFPLLIGIVIDSSNPFYRTEIPAREFTEVQLADMEYEGQYINRKQEPNANAAIHVNASVFDDGISGSVIWREIHRVTTDENGSFGFVIGKGDVISNVDFGKLNPGIAYTAEINVSRRDADIHLYDGAFTYDAENHFIARVDRRHGNLFGRTLRGSVKVFDPETNVLVWEENTRLYLDDDGRFDIPMGLGRLVYANPEYFGIYEGNYTAEVIKPLDYTNAMLVFSLLGFLGFIFAFLLKREDKTSGYGLELPNKDM
ncbi:MAG: MFS transporter [Bacteroidales bacterium]|nr:MFS transporter [Bacteroidales bacterium]